VPDAVVVAEVAWVAVAAAEDVVAGVVIQVEGEVEAMADAIQAAEAVEPEPISPRSTRSSSQKIQSFNSPESLSTSPTFTLVTV
jgi:hypothetical protein